MSRGWSGTDFLGIPAGKVTASGSMASLSYFLERGQAPAFGSIDDAALFQSDALVGPVPPSCRQVSLAQGCPEPPLEFCQGTGDRPCPRGMAPFRSGCVAPPP